MKFIRKSENVSEVAFPLGLIHVVNVIFVTNFRNKMEVKKVAGDSFPLVVLMLSK